MTIATPTTMLGAVNELLTAIGTTPVNTLDTSGMTDAAIAKDVIESIAREVQSGGWWFNTTRNTTLTPSGGNIAVPTNVTRVTPALPTSAQPGESKMFVTRENKLYDLIANSYTFTGTVRADMVWLWEFEMLPESARRYITVRAARIFQTKVLGSDQLGVFTAQHENEAYALFESDHLRSGPSTIYLDRVAQRFQSVRPNPMGLPSGGGKQQAE